MDIDGVRNVLNKNNFCNHKDMGTHIEQLIISEDDLGTIRSQISKDWVIIEKKRDNKIGKLSVDIVPKYTKF